MDRRQRALLTLSKYGLRGHRLLSRQAERLGEFLDGIMLNGLERETLLALTVATYGQRPIGRPDLYPWERRWFERDLRPAKGDATPTLLVGGAGAGREVRALAEFGYSVVAFDPVEAYVARGEALVEEGRCVAFLRGCYEDLIEKGSEFRQALEEHAPYSAVLLGWGSFNHIPSSSDRRATLVAMRELCPRGPLLLSFWLAPSSYKKPSGRVRDFGSFVGQILGGNRSSTADRPAHGIDRVSSQDGYGHFFTVQEIESLAEAAESTVSWYPGSPTDHDRDYPHATLRRKDGPPRALKS